MSCLILVAGKVAEKWWSFEIPVVFFAEDFGFFLFVDRAAGCDRQILGVPISNPGRSERKVTV